MTNKEMNKKINDMEQIINAFIEYMYMRGDIDYANLIKYYFTQSQYDKILEFLLGGK